MAGLIIYGLLAAAVVAAVLGGWNQLGHHFTDPVVASYEGPDGKLTRANARANEAEKANATLRVTIDTTVKACNAAADEFKKGADDATKRADAATAAAAARARLGQPVLSALKAKASQPAPADATCEQEREKVRSVLSDLARDVRSILGLDTSVEVIGPRRLEPKK